ncbi:MAG: ion transporter [Phyllobacteriaceae bacterium]|nr:ion transporter [Phyllobacteriaceae bacterium]
MIGSETKSRIADFVWGRDPRYGHAFDYAMIVLIVISIGMMAIETLPGFPQSWKRPVLVFDWIIVVIFTIEYGLRYWTAPQKLRYIFSFWGLIDLIAIAPFWAGLLFGLPGGEALWTLRILRIAKLLRFVANMETLQRAFELVWRELVVVFMFAVLVMFCTAVGIFFFEHEAQPEAFPSIPHSFWFAVTTLTTVGYGDIFPITVGGKVFTFVILMIGLGIVALPAGLIASAFTQAREEEKQRRAALRKEREDARRGIREAAELAEDPDAG